MTPPSLLERLKQSAVVQAVLIFIGASWVVLQVVDMLTERLGLPDWVFPVTLILLAAGLVVVLATAWVQSKAETTAAEEAGEIPTDWQVAPADVIASLKAGRLPHLTWGRAIVGGFVSLSLLLGVAGAYVLLTGRGGGLGPAEVGADEAATDIAILPFSVGNPDLQPWAEGIVDLLTPGLDGLAGFHTISSRTVLAQWRRRVGDDLADERTALSVAGSTGARYGVLGAVVALGDDVRLTAEVFDLADASKVAEASVEGSQGDLLTLVDALGIALLRDLIREVGAAGAARQLPARLTTNSLEAARAFLDGEEHYREGRFEEALQAYRIAAEADTTFGLPVLRTRQALGFHGEDERRDSADRRLERVLPYLSANDRALALVSLQVGGDTLQSIEPALRAVRQYPDDPEAWYMLGEVRYHEPGLAGGGNRPAREAFEKALELAPGFVPYIFHALEYAMGAGDTLRSRELMTPLRTSLPDDPRIAAFESLSRLLGSDAEQARAAFQGSVRRGVGQVRRVRIEPEYLPRMADLIGTFPAGGQFVVLDLQSTFAMAAGHQAQALALLAQIPRGNGVRLSLARHHQDLIGPLPGFDPDAEYTIDNCGGIASVTCREKVGIHAVDAGRLDAAREIIAWADSLAAELTVPSWALLRRRLARTVEGYMHWRTGDIDGALRSFGQARRLDHFAVSARWYHAEVLAEAGSPAEAVDLFLSMDDQATWMPFARARAAEVLERMGDRERAAELYQSSLGAWVDADAGFEWKARAEAGLARVGG